MQLTLRFTSKIHIHKPKHRRRREIVVKLVSADEKKVEKWKNGEKAKKVMA